MNMKKTILILSTLLLLAGLCRGQALHLFGYGGEDHDVYLGCLNCGRNDENSIWNPYGKYGSPYEEESIWYRFGKYGSTCDDTSPWAGYAFYSPKVMDSQGNFYGHLTVDESCRFRADFPLVLILYEHYEKIREDVGGWHDKIFK